MGFYNYVDGNVRFGDGSWMAPFMVGNDNELEAVVKRFFVLEQNDRIAKDWIDHGDIGYIGEAQSQWRTFILNNENSNFTFKYDGTLFTLDANTSYACHRQEAAFILQKAKEADKDVYEVGVEEFRISGYNKGFLS
ncbi:MAG: hypothetical protein KBA02_00135 [Paludibacteraceae bacterium]|nr:hypothetical protein [Paludibacteraceae bacterium]